MDGICRNCKHWDHDSDWSQENKENLLEIMNKKLDVFQDLLEYLRKDIIEIRKVFGAFSTNISLGVPIELIMKPIDKLQLTVRASNCLRKAQIKTIGDLLQTSSASLMKRITGYGAASHFEIKESLREQFNIEWD